MSSIPLPSFKLDRVKISLLLVVIFIYTVPFIPALAERMVAGVVVLMIVLGIMAAVKKAWTDVVITMVIALTFIIGRLQFNQVPDTDFTFRTAAALAFVFLNVTLFIGPWSRFTPHFQKFYKHRRHVGVTTFLLALTHASLIMKIYFHYSPEQAFSASFVFFGFTGLFILLWMALTSWDYVQKHFKSTWWIAIHTGLFVIYAGMVGYMYTVAVDLTMIQKMLLGSFLLFWLLAAPWSLPRKILRRVNGWKQLHVLVYLAYASVITHIWTGVVSQLDTWVQALFWTMIVGVITSHAIGWVMILKKYMEKSGKSSELISVDGKDYCLVGSVNDFEHGKGALRDVGDESLAVFRNNDAFFALASHCPHQGGPIAEGEIVNGYVECPWHKFQFSVEEGSGPPGFPDCIPYYPGTVQNNNVYISTTSTGKCNEVDGHTKFTNS